MRATALVRGFSAAILCAAFGGSAWAGPLPDQDEYVGLGLNRTTFDFVVPIFGASTNTEGSADPGRGYFRVTNGGTTSARIQLIANDGDQWKRADAPGVDEFQLLVAEYPIGGSRGAYASIPANGLVLSNPVAAGGALDFDLQINSPGTTAKGVAVSTVPVTVRAIGPESYLYNAEGDFFFRLGRDTMRAVTHNELGGFAAGERPATAAETGMIAADGAFVGAPKGRYLFFSVVGERGRSFMIIDGQLVARGHRESRPAGFHQVVSGMSDRFTNQRIRPNGYARSVGLGRHNFRNEKIVPYAIIVPRPN